LNDSALDEQPTGMHRDLSGRTTDRLRSTNGHLSENRRIIVGDLSDRRLARAHDNTITDNDKARKCRPLYDGIDAPFIEEELKVRYLVEFVRTPVGERCVFCNAVYLGETKIVNNKHGYTFLNHVWLVDFLRANNIDFDDPVPGLLLIPSKKWRNAGLPSNPKDVFVGLSAVKADRHRNIIAIESRLELVI